MDHQQEIHQLDNAHLWEVNVAKHFIVIVISHDVASFAFCSRSHA